MDHISFCAPEVERGWASWPLPSRRPKRKRPKAPLFVAALDERGDAVNDHVLSYPFPV
jgi:hypothetical protein